MVKITEVMQKTQSECPTTGLQRERERSRVREETIFRAFKEIKKPYCLLPNQCGVSDKLFSSAPVKCLKDCGCSGLLPVENVTESRREVKSTETVHRC